MSPLDLLNVDAYDADVTCDSPLMQCSAYGDMARLFPVSWLTGLLALIIRFLFLLHFLLFDVIRIKSGSHSAKEKETYGK